MAKRATNPGSFPLLQLQLQLTTAHRKGFLKTLITTMKFSAAIVAAVCAASSVNNVSAFGVHSNLAVRRQQSSLKAEKYDLSGLDGLESKLLSDEPTKKAPRQKKAPKKKAPEPEPVPAPAPEPVAAKKGGKKDKAEKYDLSGVDVPKPTPAPKPAPAPKKKIERPAPTPRVKVERPKPTPKARPEPKAKAVSTAAKDPNAGTVGVALGAAPLLAAPVIALASARSALSKTAARREEIQAEIAAKKAAEAKKAAAKATPSTDAGGVVGALVSKE